MENRFLVAVQSFLGTLLPHSRAANLVPRCHVMVRSCMVPSKSQPTGFVFGTDAPNTKIGQYQGPICDPTLRVKGTLVMRNPTIWALKTA